MVDSPGSDSGVSASVGVAAGDEVESEVESEALAVAAGVAGVAVSEVMSGMVGRLLRVQITTVTAIRLTKKISNTLIRARLVVPSATSLPLDSQRQQWPWCGPFKKPTSAHSETMVPGW